MTAPREDLTRRILSVLDGTACTEQTEVAEALADTALRAGARPYRGSDIEQWIKHNRDELNGIPDGWWALDGLLNDYRLRADEGRSLLDPDMPEADPASPRTWQIPHPPATVKAVRNRAGLWLRGDRDPNLWHNTYTDYPHAAPTWAHLLADGPLTDATHELHPPKDGTR
jgi:hypothetical protein